MSKGEKKVLLCEMLRYLMAHTPEPPRQPPEVWKACCRLCLVPNDSFFIQISLWEKLAVVVCLANWQPHDTACPICDILESSQHAVVGCKFISVAA